MSVIKANREGFAVPTPGLHTLKIYKVDDSNKDLTIVSFEDETGLRFSLRYPTAGQYEDIGTRLLTTLYANATGDFESDEIETKDMQGNYITAEVVIKEKPSKKDPSKMFKFAELKNISQAKVEKAPVADDNSDLPF